MKTELKKLIAVLLTFIMLFSMVSCSDKDTADEETTVTKNTEVLAETTASDKNEEITLTESEKESEDRTEEKTEKKKVTTTAKPVVPENTAKKNKAYLKKAIEAILACNRNDYSKDFLEYGLATQPEKELELIYNTDYYHATNPDLYPIDYDWYQDGVVNEDLLYKRIIKNTIADGTLITSNCNRVAKMVAYVAQYNIDYIKERHPTFNFNIPLYLLDTVTVDTSTEDWYYSLYVFDYNEILVNFSHIESENFFRSTVSHEVFHLLTNGSVGMDIFLSGSGVDSFDSNERPLEQNFINEYFVERASYNAFGEPILRNSYNYEKKHIELICLSTDTDFEDYESVAFGTDKDFIYYSFEEEVRNPDFVYSTLCGFDLGCFYGYFPDDVDVFDLKSDCHMYSFTNLFKNLCIRLLKEIEAGEITFAQAYEQLKDFGEQAHNIDYIDERTSNLWSEIYDIFYNYALKL